MVLAIVPSNYSRAILDAIGINLLDRQDFDVFDATVQVNRGLGVESLDVVVLEETPGRPLVRKVSPRQSGGASVHIAVDIIQTLMRAPAADCLVMINAIGPDDLATQDDLTRVRMGDFAAFLSPVPLEPWPPRLMNIWIDGSWCNGAGYTIPLSNGLPDPIPLHVALLHELAHAYAICTEEYDGKPKPSDDQIENDARLLENYHRNEQREEPPLRQRETIGSVSACRIALPDIPMTRTGGGNGGGGGSGGDCLVAESHPDGRDSDTLNNLRSVRERFLLGSGWGRRFFEKFHAHYYGFSTTVAEKLRADPEMRDVVGFAIASPLINYFRMVAGSPRMTEEEVESLPPPVRDLLGGIYGDIQRWVNSAGIGEKLEHLGAEAAAIEIAIALRFRFRSSGVAREYLERLSSEGVIPLRGSGPELLRAEEAMRTLLASADEISQVFGRPTGRGSRAPEN